VNINQALPTQAAVRITRLEMLETGTYNPMFARPYEMNVSGDKLNDIHNRVAGAGGAQVSASLFSGVASSIMKPTAAAQHQIPIHMGWAERRLRFLLHVEVTSRQGSVATYIFQGFTSHLGVSHAGSYDPTMEFIINSYIRVSNSFVDTPYGRKSESKVVESAHVLNGQIIQDQSVGEVYGMRPGDIYTGIQSTYLTNGYDGIGGGGGLIDTRVGLHGESVASRRSNCLPTNYLARVVSDYQTAEAVADYGQGTKDIYDRARDLSYEAAPTENPFIRQLSHVRGVPNQTRFTIQNLLTIDPNCSNVMSYRTLGAAISTMHQAGQTAYWNGHDNETIWAGLLSNAIPALMMELMIGQVSFTSTNDTMGAQFSTFIGDMKALATNDMSLNMRVFVARLEKEIMADLTYEGHIYHLNMTCNIYGESTIDLKLDSGAMIRFTTPSYCDGLFAPVFTSNRSTYSQLVDDFDSLMRQLPNQHGGAVGGSLGINAGI
jgi:hypothetical protein